MNLFLSHIDWSPVLYGIALFLSFCSMAWKFKRAHYLGLIIELTVVAIILIVHGGSVTGGFAATIAGLLCGWAIPFMFPQGKLAQTQPAVEHIDRVLTPYEIYQLTKRR